MNPISLLKNEQGVVILVTLMILVLLTITGIAAMRVSNTEVQIAGHETVYQRNFYRAEGATVEAVELLETIANLKNTPPAWLEPLTNTVTNNDIIDPAFWDNAASGETGLATVTAQPSGSLADTRFIAVSEGTVSGTSLIMGSSKVHAYSIYGRTDPPNQGVTIIQIGYLKAF